MSELTLYPLFFKPTYQYRLWGGRRLAHLLTEPLPEGPVGEAWLLSDRDDHASIVTEGLYAGYTLTQLFNQYPESIMGRLAGQFDRFPLLLKFWMQRRCYRYRCIRLMIRSNISPKETLAKQKPGWC